MNYLLTKIASGPIIPSIFKDKLENFRPLTIDIINKSYQMNSYFEDFKVKDSNILEDSQDISSVELLNMLFLKIQQNEKIELNSLLENLISMIPHKSNSEEFNQEDQIIKVIMTKIKKFYKQYNELIGLGQLNYSYLDQMSNSYSFFPFYPFVPRSSRPRESLPPIEFPLPSNFVFNDNVQIATNGIEIFMLVDHFVFIFKLLLGTELLTKSYKRVELDPRIRFYDKIVCYGQDILVTSKQASFIIKRKLNDEWELNGQLELGHDSIICSDGVVLVDLYPSPKEIKYSIYSLNNGNIILKRSIPIIEDNLRIYKAFKYLKFITTNGSSVSVTYEHPKGTLYDITFSLIDGKILCMNNPKIISENRFLKENNYLCILQDSINSSFWVLGEKQVDELKKIYYIGRYPSFQPYNPFFVDEMKRYIPKYDLNHFGLASFNLFSRAKERKKEDIDIFYGRYLNYYYENLKNNQEIFLFLFSTLFFNPFICHMNQKEMSIEQRSYEELINKFKSYDGGDEINQNNIKESFIFFLQNLFSCPLEESQPIASLWLLRQYQFSWYSKIHSQKMLIAYQSILTLKSIRNVNISSLFLSIFSINSIIDSMIEVDDIENHEMESALFIYFLQSIAYSTEIKNDEKKIQQKSTEINRNCEVFTNHFNFLFDLLPLISYQKRMVVTYFSFLENYGFTSLRSFYDYSLFMSMAISCLLVSTNDMKWSLREEKNDKEKVQNESSDNNNNSQTGQNESELNTQTTASETTHTSKENNNNSQTKKNEINCDILLTNMPIIYRNWKPLINKNISEKVMLFDARCLFVFYKLITGDSIDKILPEIISYIKTDQEMKLSLDLMYFYRNKYRKSMQERNDKWIDQFNILLEILNRLECQFDENDNKKELINEFLQHDYRIAYNFLYTKTKKIELITKGMDQLLKVLNDVSKGNFVYNLQQIPPESFSKNELFLTLFDSLTRFSKFNALEMIENKEIFERSQDIIQTILKIENFQCINKFSALYIIRFLGAYKNDKLNKDVLELLMDIINIEKGVLETSNIIPNDSIIFIYQALIIYLIPSYECDKIEFLKNDVREFNEFQWILLDNMIESRSIKDQSIIDHLIDNLTDIDIFIRLGNYRSIALSILNKLNQIQKIPQTETFIKQIIEKIGNEIESFSDDDGISSISSYFIDEIKKNNDNFVFKDQFIELINTSNEFTDEKRFCCSLKFISLIEKIFENPKMQEKINGYYNYAITHEHLSSSYLAMNAFNKCLSNQEFCDNFLKDSDIDQLIFKLKSNNDQSLIIKTIHKLSLLEINSVPGEDSLFGLITTNNGSYFISPVIKQSSIGSLAILKKENSIIKIFICEESRTNKLFNVVTHYDKDNFKNQTKIDLVIDMFLKQMKIDNGSMLVFNNVSNPIRLVIFSNESNIIFFNENKNIFDSSAFIDRKSYGTFDIPKKKSFLNKQKIEAILENDDDYDFSKVLQNNLNEKLCYQFLYEKNKTLFSIKDIISISENLKKDIIQSYKKHLTESTFFVTAIKMVSLHPELLNYNAGFMLKLFILLILNYDKFSIELLKKGKFPFPIENILFKSNFQSNDKFEELSRYTIQNVLSSIVNVPSFKSLFYYHMKNLFREIFSHFPRNSKIIVHEKQYNKMGFIFIPLFGENHRNRINLHNSNKNAYALPYLTTAPSFTLAKTQNQVLLFSINPDKRSWLFNSPFEFLILLKYFIYLSSTQKERELAKSCLFEAFFIQSPILSFYTVEFLKFLFLKVPNETQTNDKSHFSYQRSLQFYNQNSRSTNPFYNLFLKIELMSKYDPSISKFNQFFKELSHTTAIQDSKIESQLCLSDFSIYNNDILAKEPMNELQLFYTYQLYKLITIFKVKNNTEFQYFNFFKYWATVQQENMKNPVINPDDVLDLKKSFLSDVNDLISLWRSEYTKEVLDSFLEVNFKISKVPYSVIFKTANKLTSLQTKFQPSLILTVVLLIYRINHVFQFCDIGAAVQIIPDFIDYLTPSSSIQLIRKKIVVNQDSSTVPRVHINRKSIYINPKNSESIIEQFSKEIKKVDMFQLQCQKVPWRVTFIGEEAIDASGPSRELMNEIATSIFQANSNLTITTPSDLSLYIPFTSNFTKYKPVYYTIGIYIAIVIRTNIPQSIPFAPLVWNYMANEEITENDIVSVDKNLNEMFKNLRNAVENKCEIHFPWKATNWKSNEYNIKGKIGKFVNENEVEEFISCVIQDRINSIRDPLVEMRKGFAANLGFLPNMPFGSLFSKMAQSESTFSVEDMMAIARYRSCDFNSQSVVNFWAAVRKLTMNQRSLLLKFITTQSRIPNDITSNFTIDIVEKAPDSNKKSDDMLLGASTCFNRLYLPKYSNPTIAYQRIVTSIEYCQTMELT